MENQRDPFQQVHEAIGMSGLIHTAAFLNHSACLGVLKDYLRELPYPLITKQLYEAVLETMVQRPLCIGASGCENDAADTQHTVSLLEKLPEVDRVSEEKT